MNIGDIMQGIAGIGQTVVSGITNWKNYELQKENFEYQKSMQREAWNREDTAVSRRAADLERAGLSKTLAAGSAAQASSPIKTTAPERKSDAIMQGLATAQIAAQIMQQKADISKTHAEKEYIDLQKEKQSIQNNYLEREMLANIEGKEIENAFRILVNPETVKEKRLSNELNEQLNPQKVNKMIADIKKTDVMTRNYELESELKRLNITKAELDLVYKRLENQIQHQRLSNLEKDLLLKEVAIDIARKNREIQMYDFGKYQELGLPTSAGYDSFTRKTHIFSGGLADWLQGLGD